jgi:hypothetical protein
MSSEKQKREAKRARPCRPHVGYFFVSPVAWSPWLRFTPCDIAHKAMNCLPRGAEALLRWRPSEWMELMLSLGGRGQMWPVAAI